MAAEIENLKNLILGEKFDEAIAYLSTNKETLKQKIMKNSALLHLAVRKLAKQTLPSDKEYTLRSLWAMEIKQFSNFLQWLPQEVLEDTVELLPSLELIVLLLGCGANVNAKNMYEQTPLHIAVKIGDVGMVKFLLQHKADVNAQDSDGCTPLCLAVTQELPMNSAMIKLLLNNGAFIDQTDKKGNTPLHWIVKKACISYFSDSEIKYKRYISIINLLLDRNARMNIKNRTGESCEAFILKNPEAFSIIIGKLSYLRNKTKEQQKLPASSYSTAISSSTNPNAFLRLNEHTPPAAYRGEREEEKSSHRVCCLFSK